jgi:hypothetical protein
MHWTEFLKRKLTELKLQELESPLLDVTRNILLGYSHLRAAFEDLQGSRQVRAYNANQLVDLWRDVYGANWMWDDRRQGQSTILEGLKVELHGATLHEYLSTRPGYRYAISQAEYRQKAKDYFPQSYENVIEDRSPLSWGDAHSDIGILDVRYDSLEAGSEKRYLLGATAGKDEGSPSSFPVVVNEQVYRELAEGLRSRGAVRVEKLVGEIAIGDKRLRVPFVREFQRDPFFLYVRREQRIVVMDEPHLVLGDAWTLAEVDGKLRTLAFTFVLGGEGWEANLAEKCLTVTQFCKRHGGIPLVDFDARRQRFPDARFYPKTIAGWYEDARNVLELEQKGGFKTVTIFDQRGQTVTYQYNVQGTINFGAVQTPPDLVRELRKLQAEMQQAIAADAMKGETATDAKYQLDKAIYEAEKPQPDKKKVVDYLAQAKMAIEGIAAVGGLVVALTKAAELVEKLF